MSKYNEIRCDFFDEKEQVYCVDAWLTDDDNEDGSVIAKIDLASETVEYIDKDARTDEYAQNIIQDFLKKGYILTE